MASLCKLRSLKLQHYRQFCTVIHGQHRPPFEHINDAQATLTLINKEQNPKRMLDICLEARLNPKSPIDRVCFTLAIEKFREFYDYDSIRALLNGYLTRPYYRHERMVPMFIALYGRAGLVGDAVKLFDEMSQMGLKRTVMAMNYLLFACLLARDFSELKRVFTEYPEKYGLVPDLYTYNTVLDGFGLSGDLDSVEQVLDEMERRSIDPNATTFVSVKKGFNANNDLFINNERIMEWMERYNLVPEMSVSDISGFNFMIRSLTKSKRSAKAMVLMDKVSSSKGIKPDAETYQHLIFGFCREGKLDRAQNLFEDMWRLKLHPDAECCSMLITHLCKKKDFETALALCKDSMAKGLFPKFHPAKNLVDGLVSIKKVDEARGIIFWLKERFPRSPAFDKWKEIEKGLPRKNLSGLF